MPNMTITVSSRRPFGTIRYGLEGLRYVKNHLEGLMSGRKQADVITYKYEDDITVGNKSYPGPAAAVLVLSSASGAVGAVIGSAATTVTATAAGGDTASAGLVATAIRANTTVNRILTATNKVAKLTLSSVAAGITVTINNTTFTAVATAAAIKDFGQFNIDGSDTADATALALAINRHPSMANMRAVSSGAVVYIAPIEDRAAKTFESIVNPGTGIAANVPIAIAGDVVMVIATDQGPVGNEIACAASGTGVTAATNGTAGFLGGGTGGATPTNRVVINP